MSSEWSLSELGREAFNASRPFPFKKHPQVVFVNTGDVLQGKFLHADISESSSLPGQAKKALKQDDILLTEIRPGNGRYAFVDYDAAKYVVSTKFMVIESHGRVKPRFLYHVLTNQSSLNEFQRIAESRSGTFPQITFDSIAHFPIPVPPLDDQEELIQFFDGIGDQITLLREINHTLEAIAKAIFKSWFVDFDPVKAKAACLVLGGIDENTAALFPDSFEESPLGQMPQGWSISMIEDIADRVGMGPFGSNIKVETFVDSGIPVISGQHLKQALVEDKTFNFITEDHARKLSKSCVQNGDVIFTHAGNIGQVALLTKDSMYDRYVLSQRQFFLRCDKEVMRPEWITYYFRSTQGQHQLLANASQVGVPSIARPVTYLRSIRFLKPPMRLIQQFSNIADVLNKSVMANRSEIETLAELRDTLLPRLISGKLKLPETLEAPEIKMTVEMT